MIKFFLLCRTKFFFFSWLKILSEHKQFCTLLLLTVHYHLFPLQPLGGGGSGLKFNFHLLFRTIEPKSNRCFCFLFVLMYWSRLTCWVWKSFINDFHSSTSSHLSCRIVYYNNFSLPFNTLMCHKTQPTKYMTSLFALPFALMPLQKFEHFSSLSTFR